MATLHIHLQDGFVGEPVIVRVGRRVVLDVPNAITKPQITRAAMAEPVEISPGRKSVSVRLPARDDRIQTFPIDVRDPVTYVGISVDDAGTVTHEEQTEPLRYL